MQAARSNRLECLKYLTKINCPRDITVCEQAYMNGHFECLKHAHEYGGCSVDIFKNNYLINKNQSKNKNEIIKYINDHKDCKDYCSKEHKKKFNICLEEIKSRYPTGILYKEALDRWMSRELK